LEVLALGVRDLDDPALGVLDLDEPALGVLDWDEPALGVLDLDEPALGVLDLNEPAWGEPYGVTRQSLNLGVFTFPIFNGRNRASGYRINQSTGDKIKWTY
jgi:hypothetical protein